MLPFSCLNFSKWCPNHIFKTVLLCFFWLISQNVLISHCQRNRDYPVPHKNVNSANEIKIIKNKAEEVLKYMNTEINPCTDFYDFACGNFKNIVKSKEGEIISAQSIIQDSVNGDLIKILETAQEPGSKVKTFYYSCVSVKSNTPAHKEFLFDFVKRFGGLPKVQNSNWNNNRNWLQVVALLRRFLGLNILIGFEIDTDIHNMKVNSIYLGEPSTAIIPPENCNAEFVENKEDNEQEIEEMENQVSNNMQNWGLLSANDAEQYAKDVVSFELQLCEKMNIKPEEPKEEGKENEVEFNSHGRPINNSGTSRLSGKREINQMPRLRAEELFNRLSKNINFEQYIKDVVNGEFRGMIFIRDEKYLKSLTELITPTPKETIAEYIMYHALATLKFPNGVKQSEHCVNMVKTHFPKMTGYLYSLKYQRMKEIVYDEVNKFFEDIKETLYNSLSTKLSSDLIRNAAKQTLSRFEVQFPAYNNLQNDLRIEKQNYWQKLSTIMEYNAMKDLERLSNGERLGTIEAYDADTELMPLDNKVLIGWALLQEPFYDQFYPKSMKYALLGQYLARELVKAFDEEGLPPSQQSQRPFDQITLEELHNRTECFRTQYSNYLTNNPDEINEPTITREIMADSSGLNLAFNAYLNWLQGGNDKRLLKETLPQVDYTNTQLFFIHFAQTRCIAQYEEIEPVKGFPLDTHTSERYYINGPLSNFAEFAREFGCSISDEMNPDDKCVLY